MGYHYNDAGLTHSDEDHKTQRVFAPKNGVSGHMIPGDPSSWIEIPKPNGVVSVGDERRRKQHDMRNTSPRAGMSRELPNANDFFKRYDAELTGRPQVTPPKPEETVTPPTPTPTGPIASETRTNENGVTQTGRNLTGKLTLPDAISYLNTSTKGYVQGFGENTFGGSQLPSTPGNPYSATPSVTPGFDMSVPDIGGANAVNFDRDGGGAAAGTRDLTDDVPFTGNEQRIKGASDRKGLGRLDDALADKASMRRDTANNPEMARRAAFLDAPDSLSGMKAVKAQQNMISLGQKDYLVTGDELTAIDSGDMRARLGGRMSAEDLKNKYVKDISESKVKTPEEAQAPAVSETDTPSTPPIGRKTVPMSEIPTDLNSPEGKEYFRKLDAGLLTD